MYYWGLLPHQGMWGFSQVSSIGSTKIYMSTKWRMNVCSKASQKYRITPQLTFTCSKWTIEALEKGVKYVQS